MNKDYSHSAKGYTIVEVLVTTIIIALFVTGFFQTYLLLESQRVNTLRQAKASDVAYSNLNKYPTKPSTLKCSDANRASGVIIGDSNSGSPTAYGFVKETEISPLNANSSRQVVTAYAPNGCDIPDNPDDFKDGVVKIVSTVTYGSNGKVEHVRFIQ